VVTKLLHHFRSEPAPRPLVQVCRAEALPGPWAARRCGRIACGKAGDSGTDGLTLEPVYCLGLLAPRRRP